MNTLKNNRHWKERALLMAVADIITVMGSYFLALLLIQMVQLMQLKV